MKWAIVGKPDLGSYLKAARELLDYLKKRNQDVIVEAVLAKALKTRGTALESIKADMFVSVGGDGTVLLTLMHTEKPILSINAGGLGFLAEVDPKYLVSAVDRILDGDYRVDDRAKLACYLGKERLPDASNEVTVQTSQIAKLIKFRVEINGEVVDTMRGDGLIVATATGSTGYSLSVGGPILHPSVEALVVSPIAPFRLGSRPLVVPYPSKIKVTLLERRWHTEKPAKVVIDGQRGFAVGSNDVITIERSAKKARLIRFNGGFYDRVRTKLTR